MKLKTIITTLAAVAVLAGIFALGYIDSGGTAASVQNVNGSNSWSMLTATESLYDFGTISMRNGDVNYDFTVTNQTGKDIMVSTLVTSCMCTSALIVKADGSINGPFRMPGMGYVPPANELIKVGESRIIRVVYNPNAHGPAGVGRIDRFAILTDSSGNTLQLEIKAVVTP